MLIPTCVRLKQKQLDMINQKNIKMSTLVRFLLDKYLADEYKEYNDELNELMLIDKIKQRNSVIGTLQVAMRNMTKGGFGHEKFLNMLNERYMGVSDSKSPLAKDLKREYEAMKSAVEVRRRAVTETAKDVITLLNGDKEKSNGRKESKPTKGKG